MVIEGSPTLFAQAVTQPFQALEGYPYPLAFLQGHTAAHRSENRAFILPLLFLREIFPFVYCDTILALLVLGRNCFHFFCPYGILTVKNPF
jgi:hypothetical protein